MFKLTKREQWIVVFLAAILWLGIATKEWRARHPKPPEPMVERTATR